MRTVRVTGAFGVAPTLCISRGPYRCRPEGRLEAEVGVAFRSGFDITADLQFMLPLLTIEAGVRARWNGRLTPMFSLAPTLFAGGAYYRSPDTDDGGLSARGFAIQVGLEARIYFKSQRAGMAVRIVDFDVRWFQGKEGPICLGAGQCRTEITYFTDIRLDVGGLLVTF